MARPGHTNLEDISLRKPMCQDGRDHVEQGTVDDEEQWEPEAKENRRKHHKGRRTGEKGQNYRQGWAGDHGLDKGTAKLMGRQG